MPLAIYPPGYLKKHTLPLPLMNLRFQKDHIALYHYGIYADEALNNWFSKAYAACNDPHKINMGKSCIRFQHMDEIPYDLIGELAKRLPVNTWIEIFDRVTGRK